jgi:aspartate/methionine/tyrosine aminotransferase
MSSSPRVVHSDYMVWAKTLQAAKYNLGNSGLFNYPIAELPVRIEDLELSGPSFYGYPPLQNALARHIGVPEENLVHAIGTSMANHLAMAAVIEQGDDVLLEQPAYELLTATAAYLGANIRRFRRPAEMGFRLDLVELERVLTPKTKLIIVTNLHNPSSARITDPEMKSLAALADTVGARVLVDEVYLDAAFDLAPKTSFLLAKNIIVTSSLTKVYGLSGIRCGWILADADLARRIWRLNDLFGVIPAHAAERLSIVVLNHFDRVADRARRLLTANRELLNRFFAGRSDLDVEPLKFGTVAFPRLRRGDVDQLFAILRERYETSIVPGRYFEMPEHFRVGIGRSTADVAEGLDRLGRGLDDLAREGAGH